MVEEHEVPKHVAIIMDGNGRWAKKQRLPRIDGHREGKNTALKIVDAAIKNKIKALTLFAFSTENWKRPTSEVNFLFSLLSTSLLKESHKLFEKNIRLQFVGRRDRLNTSLLAVMEKVEKQTADNTGLILNIALDYGGRWDILNTAQQFIDEAAETGQSPQLMEEDFSTRMTLGGIPPVDVLIRTGDVCRVSNFLLWDIAYAELFFFKEMWPEFTPEMFEQMITQYAHRERRFGLISEQLETA